MRAFGARQVGDIRLSRNWESPAIEQVRSSAPPNSIVYYSIL